MKSNPEQCGACNLRCGQRRAIAACVDRTCVEESVEVSSYRGDHLGHVGGVEFASPCPVGDVATGLHVALVVVLRGSLKPTERPAQVAKHDEP